MQLLLCAATEQEIAPTQQWLTGRQLPVDILITGVGLLATMHALMKQIQSRRPTFLLQAGIAGCLDLQLPLTKIVVVSSEQIGDEGVVENGRFKNIFQMGLANSNIPPFVNGTLPNDVITLEQAGMTAVKAVSVNEITTDERRIAYYCNELGAQVESMEGAALHYVGIMEKIPFLQLRALSNFVSVRNKEEWVMSAAIAQLNVELQRLLSKMIS